VQFTAWTDHPAVAKLEVFNLAGERVSTVSAFLASNQNQILTWDCRQAAAGVYIVHFLLDVKEAGKKKIAVIK